MKIVSWNVNGIRACVKKGFEQFFEQADADIFCVQEIKCQANQIQLQLEGYSQYWNYAEKKGYSGTAVFTKLEPLAVSRGIDGGEDTEGRVLTVEFESFYLVNCYTPNSQRDLARLPYRLEWEDRMFNYLKSLDAEKPVIYCGDLNVAHHEIDLRNSRSNKGNSGFTEEERGKMTKLLSNGFIDAFRSLYPDQPEAYTWWSYMKDVRARNIGWRIDYVIVSGRLAENLQEAGMYPEVLGSDHCPVFARLDM